MTKTPKVSARAVQPKPAGEARPQGPSLAAVDVIEYIKAAGLKDITLKTLQDVQEDCKVPPL